MIQKNLKGEGVMANEELLVAMSGMMDEKLTPIKEDISELKEGVSGLKEYDK